MRFSMLNRNSDPSKATWMRPTGPQREGGASRGAGLPLAVHRVSGRCTRAWTMNPLSLEVVRQSLVVPRFTTRADVRTRR